MPQIKNLKETALRIKKAINHKENIILYGDADLDGISSVILLKEAIKNLGGEVKEIYFPDREKEGYGITFEGLKYLERFSPGLLIAVDCGITNFEEVEMAKKIGFEVIIIDHHQVLDKLPKASIIVDPLQKGDEYPFKNLATAGIVFKLTEKLLEERMSPFLRNNFLELVALATIADMMPQKSDNLEFISQGLISLKSTFRPSFKVLSLLEKKIFEKDIRQFAQKIISLCHAGESISHINECYLFLSSTDEREIEQLIKKLSKKLEQKHSKIQQIIEEVEKKILLSDRELIIFEGEKDWPVSLIGPVASKICKDFKKPVFLYSKKEDISQGAIRTPPGINGIESLKWCGRWLVSFGGHPQAGGFKIKNENLNEFKNCLIEYFKKLKK